MINFYKKDLNIKSDNNDMNNPISEKETTNIEYSDINKPQKFEIKNNQINYGIKFNRIMIIGIVLMTLTIILFIVSFIIKE